MELNTEEFLGEFLDEVSMYLEDLENSILNLESDYKNVEYLNNIFRIAHSIKGISAMMGFDKLEKLTHNMEDVLYEIRDGRAEISKKVIESLFLCRDFLQEILFAISETGNENDISMEKIDSIISKLNLLLKEEEIIDEKKPLRKLKISEEKVREIKEKFDMERMDIYYIKIDLKEDCDMRNVRSFMIINDLSKISDILESKPTLENLKDNAFNMKGLNLDIILNSKVEKIEIENNIKNNPYVDNFNLIKSENINKVIEKEDETVDRFLEEDKIGGNEIISDNSSNINETKYDKVLVEEIKKRLQNIKRKLLQIDDNNNLGLVMDCYQDIKKINSIALSMKQELLTNLTNTILKIINIHKKEEINLESKLIDFILDTVEIGIRWTDFPKLDKNLSFMQDIKTKINEMEEYLLEKEIYPENKIGEILNKIVGLTDEDIKEIKELQKKNPDKKFGEIAVETEKVKEEDMIRALRLQNKTRKKQSKKEVKTVGSINNYIRIDSNKADELVSNVGELKIMQTQIEHLLLEYSKKFGKRGRVVHGDRKKIIRMQRIMKNIQHISMSFRLIPLKSTFQKVNRTVRDTLKKVNKDVNFEIQGEGTEIDKEIADKLLKLIIHLVKNSISHGIEDTEKRRSLGKSDKGTVKLSANQSKGFISIKISDDGAGINPDKIYKSAKEKGLITSNKEYTKEEKIDLIFLPGFSTAQEVGKISGRGVGMDVVKTDIEKMGGEINIETEINKGSIFEMKIPINMSIVEGTVIKISGETYIMPNIYIREVIRKSNELWVNVKGKRSTIKVREEIISVIDLQKVFDHEIKLSNTKLFIILDIDGENKAILVDKILERREVVEKPLGEEFKHLEYVSGASILGDGKVSLILDAKNCRLK